MQWLQEARSQQAVDGTENCPPIDENMVWAETNGGFYKNYIYDMGTYYADSVSPSSVNGASIREFATNHEAIKTIFKLNVELQAQV